MNIPAEMQLMALVILLYIYDSALLLYKNEAVLMPKGRNHWAVLWGGENAHWRGKKLFFPNLLVLHRPLFRVSWQFEKDSAASGEDWAKWRALYRTLTPMVYGAALALFGWLPFTLFFSLTDSNVILTLALLYLNIMAALVWLFRQRKVLGLSRGRLAALSFECLICPPLALNLVRKLSLEVTSNEDLLRAAHRLLDTAAWQTAKMKFLAQLDDELEGEDEASTRFALLTLRRDHLSAAGDAA